MDRHHTMSIKTSPKVQILKNTNPKHLEIEQFVPMTTPSITESRLHLEQWARYILSAHTIQQRGDMVLWNIPYFYFIHRYHDRDPSAMLTSPTFTLENSYRFCLKLLAAGRGQHRHQSMSVYVQLLHDTEDDTDTVVKNDFSGLITFVVIDQSKNRNHRTQSIKALATNASFKVEQGGNPPNGVSKMISVHDLLSKNDEWNYLGAGTSKQPSRENTLIIGVSILYCDQIK
jgi:hypothetical protein